jgi:tetratricopeptide (TPR) repeat protein
MNASRFAIALASAAALSCNEAPKAPSSAPEAGGAHANLDLTDPAKLLAAVDHLQGQLKDKPKSFEVLTALGNLYYENGRYLEAVDTFRQALALAAPVEADAATLRARGVKPAKDVPLACRRSPPSYGLAQIAAQARKLASEDPAAALRCDQEALVPATGIRARRGNSLYLVGQPEGALLEHQRVLAVEPDYPESLFFVGAIKLEASHGDKAKLEEGKRFWRKLLAVAPDHPRAAIVRESLPKADEIFSRPPARPPAEERAQGASGAGPLPPGHPPLDGAPRAAGPLTGNMPGAPMAHRGAGPGTAPPGDPGPSPELVRNMADAVAQTERTPELEKGLDDLIAEAEGLLDKGDYQGARDKLVRVMPMRPQDPRTAADLGAAMRGLGRADMAERVLSRALEMDPRQPRALYELGKLSASRGDKAQALAKLRAAQAADARFAQAHDVAGEIARLK